MTSAQISRFCSMTADLTLAERQVIWLVCDGKCNKEIADLMGINLNAVKGCLRQIYRKLEVDDRLNLVIRVMKFTYDRAA